MSEMVEKPTIEIEIICSVCGKRDPQLTAGCDASNCTWRAEAVEKIVQDGGDLHMVDVKADQSTRQVTLTVAAWPTCKGSA